MPVRSKGRFLVAAGLTCLLVGLGSGCSSGEKLVEVKGKVTYGAKTLMTGVVVYHPDAAKGNKSKMEARGAIDGEGIYTLISDNGKAGVTPGAYQVSVMSTRKDPKNEYAVPIRLIPEKYGLARTSGITMQVTENAAPGTYDIKLVP